MVGMTVHIEVSGIKWNLFHILYAWTIQNLYQTGIAYYPSPKTQYTVTITDNNGLFQDTTFIITEPLKCIKNTVMTSDTLAVLSLADGNCYL